jgi:hypothetical protein
LAVVAVETQAAQTASLVGLAVAAGVMEPRPAKREGHMDLWQTRAALPWITVLGASVVEVVAQLDLESPEALPRRARAALVSIVQSLGR